MANQEISPIRTKATKSTQKRPMSYNETMMRQLLKIQSCSTPEKKAELDAKTKLLNDPNKKVPIFFFNIPDDQTDTQKTLTTEDNAAPTFVLSRCRAEELP